MSIYMSRLFPRSNSSFLLSKGNALQSSVSRLREDKFLVDAGPGTPKVCVKGELTRVPKRATRFENKVGFQNAVSRESGAIKAQILERFLIDVVAGDSQIKERAAARFNDMVGSTDGVMTAGEPHLLLPHRFRQWRAWMELNKIWRTNRKVKGFILQRIRTGYLVAIGGYVAFLPFRRNPRALSGRFSIESIKGGNKPNIVLF